MKINIILLLSLSLGLTSCSSVVKRTKYTDKNMRIMVDPDSFEPEEHVRLQHALVDSGKWVVIDRAQGMKAIQKEQERLHRDQVDRFDDRQKWAHWGRLYGVGAVVIGHIQCTKKLNFWMTSWKNDCQQFINLVDANTGEVITAIEHRDEFDADLATDWTVAVNKLNEAYPKDYSSAGIKHEKLIQYEDESAERALREKENTLNRTPAGQ